MVIVTLLGITLKDYIRLFRNNGPEILITCPFCGRKHMHKHGRYFRNAVTKFKVYRIPVYRHYCPRCKKTVSLLPAFVAPYQTFLNSLRELAIRKLTYTEINLEEVAQFISSQNIGVLSGKTVYRWKRRFKQKIPGWLADLAEKLLYLMPGLDVYTFSPGINDRDKDMKFLFNLGSFYCKAVQGIKKVKNLQLFSLMNAFEPRTNFL
ncbi:MAG: DUF6431 domain-containing protein [Eubacteriales bacterium]